MSIPFKSNFIVAKKVLAAVNKIMPKELQKKCCVEAYANCREQGYCIWMYGNAQNGVWQVSFSENRNSDDIVVYAGTKFDVQGNVPDDDAYVNRKYFRYDRINDAAKHIVSFFHKKNA